MIAIFEWPSLVFTETDAYGPVELFLSAFILSKHFYLISLELLLNLKLVF